MVAQVLNFKETEFLNGLRNVFGVCVCMCVYVYVYVHAYVYL